MPVPVPVKESSVIFRMCDMEELQACNKGEFSLPLNVTPCPMGIVKLNVKA